MKLKITAHLHFARTFFSPSYILMKSSGFKRAPPKIHFPKSNYQKFHLFANFPLAPQFKVVICLLDFGRKKEWLRVMKIKPLPAQYFASFTWANPAWKNSFTSPSLAHWYEQPILLMCQIDIVIENAVDVFVVCFIWEEKREKRKLENTKINTDAQSWGPQKIITQ